MNGRGDDSPQRVKMWDPKNSGDTKMDKLREIINAKYKKNLKSYNEFLRWSCDNYSEFWEEVWHFTGVIYSEPYKQVIDKTKNINDIPRWFEGSKLNFAENLLRYDDDRVALYSVGEGRSVQQMTFRQLRVSVARYAKAMRSMGIRSGDRVVGYIPNCSQAVEAMLAAASLGAIWSSTSPDFGVQGVLDRFTQIEPKLIFSVNAVWYNGKVHNHLEKLQQVVKGLPDLEKVVVIPFVPTASCDTSLITIRSHLHVEGVLDRFTQIEPKLIFSVNAVWYNGKVHNHLEKLQQVVKGLPDLEKVVVIPFVPTASCDTSLITISCSLDDFLSSGCDVDQEPELSFEQVPFSHPLFIMYSSGTTGAPKCMVHSVGGTLLKHLQEHMIQSDMGRDDIMMYYTTVGWMMWNWLVSVLSVGASIVLYDGSPLVPHANILWDLVDQLGVTMLGTSAKWLAVMEDRGLKPCETHKLNSLKMILSTGSPLKPQSYDYVYRDIKKDLLLASISGGTDIIACFMGQNWTIPVYRGQVQGFVLGCDMQAWDDTGKPVYDMSGELVCLKPFPSMPVYFWNDPDGSKYRKAYFDMYPGVWAHGDYCCVDEKTGGITMLGRSDGVLNPNGVRFGSAEIYNVVESFKEIQDSVCVAQRKKDLSEERVVLFLKMAPDSEFTSDIASAIKKCIRLELSARHVPEVVLPVGDIPYTISGKKVESAVRRAIQGLEVVQRGALGNPASVDLYYNIKDLQDY